MESVGLCGVSVGSVDVGCGKRGIVWGECGECGCRVWRVWDCVGSVDVGCGECGIVWGVWMWDVWVAV